MINILVIVALVCIALAQILTGSMLMLTVLIFAIVALGAVFTATYYLNKDADSAGR